MARTEVQSRWTNHGQSSGLGLFTQIEQERTRFFQSTKGVSIQIAHNNWNTSERQNMVPAVDCWALFRTKRINRLWTASNPHKAYFLDCWIWLQWFETQFDPSVISSCFLSETCSIFWYLRTQVLGTQFRANSWILVQYTGLCVESISTTSDSKSEVELKTLRP